MARTLTQVTPSGMRVPLLLLLVGFLPAFLPAADIPPSPSTVPGKPLPPEAAITHVPGIVYVDERRSLAFRLPPGQPGTIGWAGGPTIPVVPHDNVSVGGLLELPQTLGTSRVDIHLGDQSWTFPVRLVAAKDAWTWDRLVDGVAVDADGVPVVLVDERPHPELDRRWQLVTAKPSRGRDPGLLIGDDLAGPDGDVFTGLPATEAARIREARRPDLAALVALSKHLAEGKRPRSLLWSPGNEALRLGAWTAEEERILGVIKTRCVALGFLPRLALLLPPTPLDDREGIQSQSRERRDMLKRSAAAQGWVVVDADRWCGAPESATALPGGGYATHPVGDAHRRLAAAIQAELAR